MTNGLINIYKEKGFTSFDVVAVLRGIFGQRKIGHTGTLDPNAEGVLVVCLGNATKLCDMLTDKKKAYVATFMLGKRTDTLDITGEVLEEKPFKATEEEVRKAILSFVGGYDQIPPMYSAKKVNGKKLYDMARSGAVIERKPVHVDIFNIEILDMDLPNVTIQVSCGKGTYIRSLCEDIGAKCGELSVMTSLKRIAVNEFTADNAYTLDDLKILKSENKLEKAVIPTDVVFSELRKATVLPEKRKLIDNGNKLLLTDTDIDFSVNDSEELRIYNDEERFAGVYRYDQSEDMLKPFKMFIGE
ncbi:MAG: tRNA pseudouridine(55) synthase TruB [Lachnospiraceae bacterium]|nr:tRNA pseudouridine(55) synthase TruB [Lachnospiraceae bacterium]